MPAASSARVPATRRSAGNRCVAPIDAIGPGTRSGVGQGAIRSVTVGAPPRHPVLASITSLLTPDLAGADPRSRLKPNRITGTPRLARRSALAALDVRAWAGEKVHQGIFTELQNTCWGSKRSQSLTASRPRTVGGEESRRVRVFSAITIRGLEGSLALIRLRRWTEVRRTSTGTGMQAITPTSSRIPTAVQLRRCGMSRTSRWALGASAKT